jgi:2-oxoglutarate ferredoxin oxidoreductase subunit delta
MVKHIVDIEKCRGCGKCIEECGLELWELVDSEEGNKIAQAIAEAKDICHMCLACRDACPEDAITIIED